MLSKRIIPCLDVKQGKVVKGIQFRDHRIMGGIIELACRYQQQGADELVFYDITASSDQRSVACAWVTAVAKVIDIPFCVAGGIRDLATAKKILHAGADKISINSPALERPQLINELAEVFGKQCIVVGVDSRCEADGYFVYQYSGDAAKMRTTRRDTFTWLEEVQQRGAGEIVLNCMDQDGVKKGYDLEQLSRARSLLSIPLIASGGAGCAQHFVDVFQQAHVDGALAASVFHAQQITIPDLKSILQQQDIAVRTLS
jgi:imidazole glycerol-phosphate synthase subunit HisF